MCSFELCWCDAPKITHYCVIFYLHSIFDIFYQKSNINWGWRSKLLNVEPLSTRPRGIDMCSFELYWSNAPKMMHWCNIFGLCSISFEFQKKRQNEVIKKEKAKWNNKKRKNHYLKSSLIYDAFFFFISKSSIR